MDALVVRGARCPIDLLGAASLRGGAVSTRTITVGVAGRRAATWHRTREAAAVLRRDWDAATRAACRSGRERTRAAARWPARRGPAVLFACAFSVTVTGVAAGLGCRQDAPTLRVILARCDRCAGAVRHCSRECIPARHAHVAARLVTAHPFGAIARFTLGAGGAGRARYELARLGFRTVSDAPIESDIITDGISRDIGLARAIDIAVERSSTGVADDDRGPRHAAPPVARLSRSAFDALAGGR